MEEKTRNALKDIDRACDKIHGVAGLLAQGSTTEEIVLQKVDAEGISIILRDCARDIQEVIDGLSRKG
jgi:hypothetical protein